MHIVTKILVVFAAVLSILLAALTIAYAANADRIVSSLRGEQALRLEAEASKNASLSQAADEAARLKESLASVERDRAQFEAQIRQLQSEGATLLADKRGAEAARASFENRVQQLGDTVKTQAELIQNYRKEVGSLRENELRARSRELDLVDRVNELESQVEVLDQTRRALEEQLAEARMSMEQGLAVRPGVGTAPAAFTGPVIRGRVSKTMRDEATGKLLAQIDVGTNDNVRQGMTMLVTRGSEFVANLRIIQTDLRFSVGEIDTLGRPVEVRGDDLVISRLRD